MLSVIADKILWSEIGVLVVNYGISNTTEMCWRYHDLPLSQQKWC